jgi:hypothetical protein
MFKFFTMKGLLDKTFTFHEKIKKTLLSKQTDQNKLKSKYSSNYKRNTLFLNRNFNVTNV